MPVRIVSNTYESALEIARTPLELFRVKFERAILLLTHLEGPYALMECLRFPSRCSIRHPTLFSPPAHPHPETSRARGAKK